MFSPRGGPARSTETLPMYVYNTAFQHYRFEKGMAGSNILMAVVLTILVLYGLMMIRGNPLRQLGRREGA